MRSSSCRNRRSSAARGLGRGCTSAQQAGEAVSYNNRNFAMFMGNGHLSAEFGLPTGRCADWLGG